MELYLAIGAILVAALFAAVAGGFAIWASRLGSLISLHHHLARGTNDNDDPKRGVFRTSRRLISRKRRSRH
jgi:hypothetical protein